MYTVSISRLFPRFGEMHPSAWVLLFASNCLVQLFGSIRDAVLVSHTSQIYLTEGFAAAPAPEQLNDHLPNIATHCRTP